MKLHVKPMVIAILLLVAVLLVGYCSAQSQGEESLNTARSAPDYQDDDG